MASITESIIEGPSIIVSAREQELEHLIELWLLDTAVVRSVHFLEKSLSLVMSDSHADSHLGKQVVEGHSEFVSIKTSRVISVVFYIDLIDKSFKFMIFLGCKLSPFPIILVAVRIWLFEPGILTLWLHTPTIIGHWLVLPEVRAWTPTILRLRRLAPAIVRGRRSPTVVGGRRGRVPSLIWLAPIILWRGPPTIPTLLLWILPGVVWGWRRGTPAIILRIIRLRGGVSAWVAWSWIVAAPLVFYNAFQSVEYFDLVDLSV